MAAKIFGQDIVNNPTIIGFMLMKNFNFFEIINDPKRILGPMKVFAAKLRESDRKKARDLEKEVDDLERKIKSASKEMKNLTWVRMIKSTDIKDFSTKVTKLANFNSLKDFQKKLSQIRNVLISIGTKTRKYV